MTTRIGSAARIPSLRSAMDVAAPSADPSIRVCRGEVRAGTPGAGRTALEIAWVVTANRRSANSSVSSRRSERASQTSPPRASWRVNAVAGAFGLTSCPSAA
ncbi:hypothetical protein BJF90_45520 [Pseudonocardia sp. CNS-004]|nr:hypothetical protein BJF90_45520 [Pseudonocardia sp. CNS-004]